MGLGPNSVHWCAGYFCTPRTTATSNGPLAHEHYFLDMPIIDTPIARTPSTRHSRPVLAREFAGGAVLGALVWLAICSLGFHAIFGLSVARWLGPAALLGGLLGVTRFRALLWVGGAALAALFAVVSFTPLIVQPVQGLIRSDPMPSPPLRLDAVVVLSSGVTTDGVLDSDGTERLLSALRLARATGTSAIVTTRVRNPGLLDVSSDADQKKLVELAGSGLRLFIVTDVFSTRDEALRVRELARQQQWARVAVVTSPPHSRRACGAFEKAGLRVTCVPAESRQIGFRTLDAPGDRVEAFKWWIYEFAGTVNYRVKGWLP